MKMFFPVLTVKTTQKNTCNLHLETKLALSFHYILQFRPHQHNQLAYN